MSSLIKLQVVNLYSSSNFFQSNIDSTIKAFFICESLIEIEYSLSCYVTPFFGHSFDEWMNHNFNVCVIISTILRLGAVIADSIFDELFCIVEIR